VPGTTGFLTADGATSGTGGDAATFSYGVNDTGVERAVDIAIAGRTVTVTQVAHDQSASEDMVYYHTDAIGSVRMVSDANGEKLRTHDFLAFGQNASNSNPSGDSLMFAGHERDPGVGADYFGARFYVPFADRFSSPDPLSITARRVAKPYTLNRYVYAANNPLRFVDPTGLDYVLMKPDKTLLQDAPFRGDFADLFIWATSGGLEWLVDISNLEEGAFGHRGGTQYETDFLYTLLPEDFLMPKAKPPKQNPSEQPPNDGGGFDGATEVAKRFLQCTADQFGLRDIFAAGSILAGQPISGTKRFVTAGSSRGTSLAGKLSNAVFGEATFPFRLRVPTIVGGIGTGTPLRIAGTRSIARFAGRAVPMAGWMMLAYDGVRIAMCTSTPSVSQ
jgi:RHS repeat-associated protein